MYCTNYLKGRCYKFLSQGVLTFWDKYLAEFIGSGSPATPGTAHMSRFQFSKAHPFSINAAILIADVLWGWKFNLCCSSTTYRKDFILEILPPWTQVIRVSFRADTENFRLFMHGIWNPELILSSPCTLSGS